MHNQALTHKHTHAHTQTHTHKHTCTNNTHTQTEHRQALELSEQRRQSDLQDQAFRENARRQQAHHLAEVASLNREVGHPSRFPRAVLNSSHLHKEKQKATFATADVCSPACKLDACFCSQPIEYSTSVEENSRFKLAVKSQCRQDHPPKISSSEQRHVWLWYCCKLRRSTFAQSHTHTHIHTHAHSHTSTNTNNKQTSKGRAVPSLGARG